MWTVVEWVRVALSARTDEPGSSIVKDLIDSEEPKHTLFCRETAFVATYALFFRGNIPILLLKFKYICQLYRTEKLWIKQKSF